VGILDGVRILDFTQYQAGPYGTALLADFGADVIKVERPGGEPGRSNHPTYDGVNAFFLANNRGKRSLCLDLTKPAAIDVVRRLIASADALVHNLKPGAMERLGLGEEEARRSNPRLVYGAVSTFGPSGSKREMTGVDLIAQAESGTMSVTGFPDRAGTPVGAAFADALGGINLAFSVVAALLARERTGRGQGVHVSLVGGLLGLQAWEMQNYLLSRSPAPRAGTSHPLIKTIWQSFHASDGDFVVAEVKDSWAGLCKALGRVDLAADERFRSAGRRLKHRAALLAEIVPEFSKDTVAGWVQRLRAEGVLAAPVRTYADLADDSDLRADGYVRTFDYPERGPIDVAGPFLHFSADPPSIRRPPPKVGEHSDEVLAEAGYSPAEIATLREATVLL
jgi:crotonobetainyl-CoA:carnitine CoA-transferase CaiB-like acyl-CoA transferase